MINVIYLYEWGSDIASKKSALRKPVLCKSVSIKV